MHHPLIRTASGIVVCVIAALTATGFAAERETNCSWSVAENRTGPELMAVETSRFGAWSVGAMRRGDSEVPVVRRLSGGTWVDESVPHALRGTLEDVTVAPDGTVWAVGTAYGSFPLVLRRSSGRWAVVPPPVHDGFAQAEAAVAGFGLLIAGGDSAAGVYDPHVILRRRGSKWVTPGGGRINEGLISGLDATAWDDAWAVGYQGGADTINTIDALIMHWNGRRWAPVPLPPERIVDTDAEPVDGLYSVAAVGRRRAWAVGSDQAGATVFGWNGRRWVRAQAPALAGELYGVAASAGTAWAVGATSTGPSQRPAIFAYRGTRWVRESLPSGLSGALRDVTPGRDAWAVGGRNASRTLVLHHACR